MESRDLRIIYMGTPEFAVFPLRALVESGYNVVAVITTPDKPAGRGLKLQQSAVKQYAVSAALPVMQPEKLKDPGFLEELRGYDADLQIVVAFRMLPEAVWSMPRLGTFNLHASLLPQYRGAAPINWAVINGETESGVTTFFLNSKMDEGSIIAQRKVTITPEDTAGMLHDKLMNTGTGLVLETVNTIASGTVKPQSQEKYDPATLKPAPKIFKNTCRIDFSRRGDDIVNLIRGLSPYPAAWAEMSPADNEFAESITVKIFSAVFEEYINRESPGIIKSDGKTYIKVACADGYINVKELQVAGKKRMPVTELMKGFKNICSYRFI